MIEKNRIESFEIKRIEDEVYFVLGNIKVKEENLSNILLAFRKVKTSTNLYSWRVGDNLSIVKKEPEDTSSCIVCESDLGADLHFSIKRSKEKQNYYSNIHKRCLDDLMFSIEYILENPEEYIQYHI